MWIQCLTQWYCLCPWHYVNQILKLHFKWHKILPFLYQCVYSLINFDLNGHWLQKHLQLNKEAISTPESKLLGIVDLLKQTPEAIITVAMQTWMLLPGVDKSDGVFKIMCSDDTEIWYHIVLTIIDMQPTDFFTVLCNGTGQDSRTIYRSRSRVC